MWILLMFLCGAPNACMSAMPVYLGSYPGRIEGYANCKEQASILRNQKPNVMFVCTKIGD